MTLPPIDLGHTIVPHEEADQQAHVILHSPRSTEVERGLAHLVLKLLDERRALHTALEVALEVLDDHERRTS